MLSSFSLAAAIVKSWYIKKGVCEHCVHNLDDTQISFQLYLKGFNIKDSNAEEIEDLLQTNKIDFPIAPCSRLFGSNPNQ